MTNVQVVTVNVTLEALAGYTKLSQKRSLPYLTSLSDRTTIVCMGVGGEEKVRSS